MHCFRRICAVVLCLALPLLLCACEEKGEEFTVTVENLTDAEISALYMMPETDKTSHTNRLTENLAVEEARTISLGRLTEAALADGFSLEAYSAADGSSQSFSMLQVQTGDRVSFYIDTFGLAVAVNQTRAEIDAQIQRDADDVAAMNATTSQTTDTQTEPAETT